MCKCYPGVSRYRSPSYVYLKTEISRGRAERIPSTTVAGRAHRKTDPMLHVLSSSSVGSLD